MKLYRANIYHKRFKQAINEFIYNGFYIKFDLTQKKSSMKLFSFNKFNLFSFYDKDHGYRDQSDLKQWVIDTLKEAQVNAEVDRIELQTFPRMMGYVFNPVSFWFCYNGSERVATIFEVNNTFGESHNYVVTQDRQTLPKQFHVSPFFDVEGEYRFDISENDRVIINYFQQGTEVLKTSITGREIEASSLQLFKLFFTFPFYTMWIVLLIHYQALIIWFKGCTFYTLPEKNSREVTSEYNY